MLQMETIDIHFLSRAGRMLHAGDIFKQAPIALEYLQ
jgi:hypothetical protein